MVLFSIKQTPSSTDTENLTKTQKELIQACRLQSMLRCEVQVQFFNEGQAPRIQRKEASKEQKWKKDRQV